MPQLLFLFFILLVYSPLQESQPDFFEKLAASAVQLTEQKVTYDPSYCRIAYPNGDVPANKGVCTDLIIRAYRQLGIDLQKEVHLDMKQNFGKYPKKWGMTKPDTNIDHRRVPNLMTFFQRKGEVKPITRKASDYQPGDIVCWILPGGQTHIGIVVDVYSTDKQRPMIVHNIGNGQELSDCLFEFTLIGHYRYKK